MVSTEPKDNFISKDLYEILDEDHLKILKEIMQQNMSVDQVREYLEADGASLSD